MFCSRCGNNTPDGATNCTACGAPLRAGAPQQSGNPYQMPQINTGGMPGMVSQDEKPASYLWQSIMATVLGTLCCCIPLFTGIPAIVFATQVDSKWNSGDQMGAHNASKNAKLWTIITAVLIILGIIIYILVLPTFMIEFQKEFKKEFEKEMKKAQQRQMQAK